MITAKRRAASFRALTGRFGRLPALVWLPAAALVLAVAVARGASQEPICALRDHIDAPTIQRDWPAVRRWCSQIMRAADRHYLNPHLIAALILVESGGDPLAYSSDGAVGLMQVMPRDGIAAGFWCYGRPCFANRPSIAELQDPAFNVDYGAMLLRFNLDRLGTWRDALRAYGPIYVGYDYADLVLAVFARVNP